MIFASVKHNSNNKNLWWFWFQRVISYSFYCFSNEIASWFSKEIAINLCFKTMTVLEPFINFSQSFPLVSTLKLILLMQVWNKCKWSYHRHTCFINHNACWFIWVFRVFWNILKYESQIDFAFIFWTFYFELLSSGQRGLIAARDTNRNSNELSYDVFTLFQRDTTSRYHFRRVYLHDHSGPCE